MSPRTTRRSNWSRGSGGQDGVEGLEVRVDVAQDEIAHRSHHPSRSSVSLDERLGLLPRRRRGGCGPAGRRRDAPGRAPRGDSRSVARGRRPSVGTRSTTAFKRQVEPDHRAVGQHRGAVLRVHEGAAPGGHDHVAHRAAATAATPRSTARKYGSPSLPEDVRNRSALQPLDGLVEILDSPVEPARQRPCHGRLAGAHEPDQIDLVRPHVDRHGSRRAGLPVPLSHADGPARSKKPGIRYRRLPAAPVIVDGPCAPRAATANAMASRWSSQASAVPPASGRGTDRRSRRAVPRRRRPAPAGRDEGGDPVALLGAQLAGAGDHEAAPEGGERRQRWKFVDERWHLQGQDLERPQVSVADGDGADRFAGRHATRARSRRRAPARTQDVEHGRPGWVQADVGSSTREPGQGSRRHCPENRGGDVAGDVERPGRERLAACEADAWAVARDGGRRTPARLVPYDHV